jgi:Domain of unknown function (DUF4158)
MVSAAFASSHPSEKHQSFKDHLMGPDTGEAQTATRVMYPDLPEPLTPADLHRLFTPNYAERQWSSTVARTASWRLALIVQLKIFQTIGRFRRVEEIPGKVIEHIAERLGVECEPRLVYPDRTLYRHRPVVLKYLGIAAWRGAARALVQSTMRHIAKSRTDPGDLLNGAIDAFIANGFELPALDTLLRLAATTHSTVNAAQWNEVYGQLNEQQRSTLESMLIVDGGTQHSPFVDLCRAPGRASRKNLQALIERYDWLQDLPDPTTALRGVADAKVLQWANEARRLKAPELREYIVPRRQTLLLALIRHARGQVLDDLTQMLLRLVRKIEWKSEQRLDKWYADRHDETDSLIRAFHDSLISLRQRGESSRQSAATRCAVFRMWRPGQIGADLCRAFASRKAHLATLRSSGLRAVETPTAASCRYTAVASNGNDEGSALFYWGGIG